MQTILGIDKSEGYRVEEATSFLRSNGYLVVKKDLVDKSTVKNASELVDLFYALLQYHNTGRRIHYSKSNKLDFKLAKDLIKSRQEISGDKKGGLMESAAIVRCVVENESLFMFKEPLSSFSCFGTDTMKWVVDKAISIINSENYEAEKRDRILYMESLQKKQESEASQEVASRIEDLKGMLED